MGDPRGNLPMYIRRIYSSRLINSGCGPESGILEAINKIVINIRDKVKIKLIVFYKRIVVVSNECFDTCVTLPWRGGVGIKKIIKIVPPAIAQAATSSPSVLRGRSIPLHAETLSRDSPRRAKAAGLKLTDEIGHGGEPSSTSLMMGARGTIPTFFAKACKQLGISNIVIKNVAKSALRGSLSILHHHLYYP
ncbi:hypothetical protein C0J52_06292 [Blattella germanica]|nr:hypothetical protein C0J52_06292 [Blattella germanica]